LILVLHHVAEPQRVFAEAARVLKANGRLLVVDMLAHDREELRRDMGHVWLGFDERRLSRWLAQAGFASLRFTALPAEPDAKGPSLFSASAIAAPEQTLSELTTPAPAARAG
jgi:ArsR family transcriptional regulator